MNFLFFDLIGKFLWLTMIEHAHYFGGDWLYSIEW